MSMHIEALSASQCERGERGEIVVLPVAELGTAQDLAHREGFLVARFDPPGPASRGDLALLFEVAIEHALERLASPPPGVGAASDLDSSLSDQLYRARFVGAHGIAIVVPALDGLTNLAGTLDAEDSAVLRWWLAATTERPVRLLVDASNRYLGVYGPPSALDDLVQSPRSGEASAPAAERGMEADAAAMDLVDEPPVSDDAVSVSPCIAIEAEPSESECFVDARPVEDTTQEEFALFAPLALDSRASLEEAPSMDAAARDAEMAVHEALLIAAMTVDPTPMPEVSAVTFLTAEPANDAGADATETPALALDVLRIDELTASAPAEDEPEPWEMEAAPPEPRPIAASCEAGFTTEACASREPDADSEEARVSAPVETLVVDLESEPARAESPSVAPTVDSDATPASESAAVEPPASQSTAVAPPEPPEGPEDWAHAPEIEAASFEAALESMRALESIRSLSVELETAHEEAPEEDEKFDLEEMLAEARPTEPEPEPEPEAEPEPEPARPCVPPLFANAAQEWRKWASELDAARGPKSLSVVERLFVSAYMPLADAVACGIAEESAKETLSVWAASFEKSYTDAFEALRHRGKRPTMVLDVPEIALRLGRLHGARAFQLVLVDGMRFDLGMRMHEKLRALVGQRAVCAERLLLWAGLPTTTATQLRLLGRGPSGLRDAEPTGEPDIPVARGDGSVKLRRVKTGHRELYKLDVVEASLAEPAGPLAERIDQLAGGVASALAHHLERVAPRTLVMVFGDHGFRTDRLGEGTAAATQGGASPEEVLVPAFAWLVGAVH